MFLRDDDGLMHFYPRVDMADVMERLEVLVPLAGDFYVIGEDGEAFKL